MCKIKLHTILFHTIKTADQLDIFMVYSTHRRQCPKKIWAHGSVFVLPYTKIHYSSKTAASPRMTMCDVRCHVPQESVPPILEYNQPKTVGRVAG